MILPSNRLLTCRNSVAISHPIPLGLICRIDEFATSPYQLSVFLDEKTATPYPLALPEQEGMMFVFVRCHALSIYDPELQSYALISSAAWS